VPIMHLRDMHRASDDHEQVTDWFYLIGVLEAPADGCQRL